MYIVAIAWMYVTLLMAATEKSMTAGVLTFIFYGLLPCALFVWIFTTPQRKRNRARKEADTHDLDKSTQPIFSEPDRPDTKSD